MVRCEPYGTYYASFKEYGNTRRIALKTKAESAAKLKLADLLRKRHGTKVEQFSLSRSNAALGIVNSIFEIAIKQRWRSDNPAAGLKRSAQYKTEEYHRLDPDEIPTEIQISNR